MTTLEDWISQACKKLGIHVDLPFTVNIGNGHEVRAVARIRGFGASNGMLVIQDYEDVRPYAQTLALAGYGYSVLDEPRGDEAFDLGSFKEMFLDWGWAGSEADYPQALR
jgi:hypothetical protein